MDAYEATRIVFSRIQTLDPENASKIMGLLLIQDYGEKEMIRLAFGPESLLHSLIFKSRSELRLSSTTPSAPISPPSPFLSRQSSSPSPRLLGVGGGAGFSLPPPLAIPSPPSSTWDSPSSFSDVHSPDELGFSPNSSSASFRAPNTTNGPDLLDEFRFQDHLSFLSDYCLPANRNRAMLVAAASFPGYGGPEPAASWGGLHHRRSCSFNDACFASDDLTSGFGWKPCLYYSRGFCKNGGSCRFLHGGGFENPSPMAISGSEFPTKLEMDQYPDLLKSKYGHRMAVPALMSAEDMNKFGRFRMECAAGMLSPSSRQIYLTFPADSTFREEDVSNYFSIYGPVQDVRIPYQQKRMFGFVSFVYAETVRIILAKGNPHFVCDARVLVKPYKEKGKVPEKYRKQQQQQIERLEQFSTGGSPTVLDSRDAHDFQLGGRMVYSNQQDMLWRRKMEEQADLQQAIEHQNRRFSCLQLHRHPSLDTFTAFQPRTSTEIPPDSYSPEAISDGSRKTAYVGGEKGSSGQIGTATSKEDSPREDSTDSKEESLEHNLPDNIFTSPKKSVGEHASVFSDDGANNSGEAINSGEAEQNMAAPTSSSAPMVPITSSSLLLAGSTLGMASLKSCYFSIPSFSPSQETVGV